ncbi:MAG TPA: hypothetical protein VJ814_03690 [Gaiellaceae bacterium]|nr:hypothetical protein [Gaiellaceae bacterium]
MFPDHHLPYKTERTLRPDRRPLPRANEIRLRIKRAVSRGEV